MSLDQFRRIIGWHPLHFWGLSSSTIAPITSSCNDLIRQANWQGTDAVGRNEISAAIERAEDKLNEYLGFAVASRYAQVAVPWPTFAQNSYYRPAYAQSIPLPGEGYVSAFGTETRTLLDTPTIAYSAVASLGFDDTATITVATLITDPTRFVIVVPAADQIAQRTADGETWRIIPSKIDITAGVATFTIPSWLLVKPILYESFVISSSTGIDPADSASYLTELDVFDSVPSANHGTAYYDFAPYPMWCCGGAGVDPSAVTYGNIRSAIVNPTYGIVNPVVSIFDTTNSTWHAAAWGGSCRAPDRLLLNIVAGVARAPNGDMATEYAQIVARLAMAEIQGEPCGCISANHTWAYWQTDISRTSGPDQYAFKEAALNNPFGVKRGHIEAWQAVLRLQHVRAILTH